MVPLLVLRSATVDFNLFVNIYFLTFSNRFTKTRRNTTYFLGITGNLVRGWIKNDNENRKWKLFQPQNRVQLVQPGFLGLVICATNTVDHFSVKLSYAHFVPQKPSIFRRIFLFFLATKSRNQRCKSPIFIIIIKSQLTNLFCLGWLGCNIYDLPLFGSGHQKGKKCSSCRKSRTTDRARFQIVP